MQPTHLHSLFELPSEIIYEIINYSSCSATLIEYNSWMLLSKKFYKWLSSDLFYKDIYWKEVNYWCNVFREEIYDTKTYQKTTEVHPLYAKYGQINSNFRNELIKFKKEFNHERVHYNYQNHEIMRIDPPILDNNEKYHNCKVVMVGDSFTVPLFQRICFNNVEEHFQPVFDYAEVIHSAKMKFSIWKTHTGEDYYRLVPLFFPDTDIYIICFSLINRQDFENVKKKWIRDVRAIRDDPSDPKYSFNNVGCPVILIGHFFDRREQEKLKGDELTKSKLVSTEEGEALAKYLGCITYVECDEYRGYGTEKFTTILFNTYLEYIKRSEKKKMEKEKLDKKKCFIQ